VKHTFTVSGSSTLNISQLQPLQTYIDMHASRLTPL